MMWYSWSLSQDHAKLRIDRPTFAVKNIHQEYSQENISPSLSVVYDLYLTVFIYKSPTKNEEPPSMHQLRKLTVTACC